ncbi:endonuclease I family protein [Myroides profundi]|uniref:Endonuclease I n=1 Tax=Myroides profundi TaxID=480520 RepID=A0AAJ4W2N4_MYRPR|nr:endonuclease [Myroides profundi]AJH14195.1 endoglucanase [Myroides profundi]SEQ38532.1 Endonuclease I [Myroides profundi]
MKKINIILISLLLGITACSKDPIITDPDNTGYVKPTPPTGEEDNSGYIPITPEKITVPQELQAYYADIDFTKTGTALKKQLHDKLEETHTKKLKYTPEVWEAIKATDYVPVKTGKPTHVYLIYGHNDKPNSSDKEAYTREISKQNAGGSGKDTWNREHVYTQDAGNFDTKPPGAGTDVHNLRSADVDWNGLRGNKKFAEGNGYSADLGQNLWYPGNEWKGDVARMMMYMYVRYGEQCLPSKIGVGSTAKTPDGMIDLFLKWHQEDPVSDIERRRNEYHGNPNNPYAQGNRNPFIDNPYLANMLWSGPTVENTWK